MAGATSATTLGTFTDQTHLQCPICCGRFHNPKILNCLHSFCLNCLEGLASDPQQPEAIIACPVCGQVTGNPDAGLGSLTTCSFLSLRVDEVTKCERLLGVWGGERGETPAHTPTCDQCEGGKDAIARCQDCDENICRECQAAHGRWKPTRNHRIVTADSLLQTGMSTPKDIAKIDRGIPMCRRHANQEVSFYCHTCEMLVCAKCAALDHRTMEHKCGEVEDAIRSLRENIDEALQKFERSKDQFRDSEKLIEHAKARLRMMVDQAHLDISATEEDEIAKIRSKSRLLRERVAKIGRERETEYDEELSGNRDRMNRGEHIATAVQDLMQEADDLGMLELRPKVVNNVEFLRELQFHSTAQPSLSFKRHDVKEETELGEIFQEERWELKDEFGKEGEGNGEFSLATDVGCFSSGEIAVTDIKNKRLTILSSTGLYGGKLVQVEEDQPRPPYGVAVTQDDLLLVTDGKKVKVFDINLQLIRQFVPSQDDGEGNSESFLTDIDVDQKRRVAVADREKKVISLHNLDGSLITRIPHETIHTDLAISSRERLVFTNYMGSRLLCVDFTGRVVFDVCTSFDGKPAKPAGVCCDDAGEIYVSTHHNQTGSGEVHHFDPEGVYVGRVAQGLYNPLNMAFTSSGDLVVADMHSIKIFRRA